MKTIKLLFATLALSLSITSCQKEPEPSNCGTILSVDFDNVYHNVYEPGVYPTHNPTTITDGPDPNDPSRFFIKLTIQNEVSGNIEDFYFLIHDFQIYSEFNDNQLSNLAAVYDSTGQYISFDKSKVVGKRFCIFNKWSANNSFQISDEPIFW